MNKPSPPMLSRKLQYGRKRIEYQLQYSSRRTLGIDVNPDLSVVVTAPDGSDDHVVEQKVEKRAAWIIQQQRFFENFLPAIPPRKFVSGEAHRYLGRQYRLRIYQGSDESVKMSRGQLVVTLKDRRNNKRVRTLVQRWFRNRADVVFQELFDQVAERAKRYGIEADSFQIRKMKTRWGSCTKDGIILLNSELIAAPKICIEYVIVHELCHLKEYNHGSEFYSLLKKLMPDWEKRRERLNRCVVA